MRTVIEDIRIFQAQFSVANEDSLVTDNLLVLVEQYLVGGKQIHDANIVATMVAHRIPRLLTANVADFARFGALIVVEPLIPA